MPLTATRPRSAVLSLGFRPFFLAAGVSAALSLAVWLGMLHGLVPINRVFAGSAWHAHEMLFGYGLAVIAGFLLTAAGNWTGRPTATGPELAALAALWLLGRALPWLALPAWVAALLAAALPLALAASLWRVLWGDENPVNRALLGILAGFGLAAALSHLQASGALPAALVGALPDANRLMLDLMLLTLLIVSGRILPFFTRVGLRGAAPRTSPTLERLTFGVALVWIGLDLYAPWPALTGVAALVLALMVGLRIAGWYDRRVWRVPILGVLYAGAAWLVGGLVLAGLAAFGLLAPTPALHALTAGAFGVFTLGMMVRITLGHTGRPMQAPPALVAAFVAVNLAALVRVALPVLAPAGYGVWMLLSGLLWVGAFVTFLIVIGPMLLGPRVDRPSMGG